MRTRFWTSSRRVAATGLFISGILLLAGCTLSLPPNIPRVTETLNPLTQTPAGTILPFETTYPIGPTETGGIPTPQPTNTVAVVTATTAATSAPPTVTTAPTNTPQPSATTAPTATTSTSSGTNGTTGNNPSSIVLPAQRNVIQFAANTTSAVVTANLQNGSVVAYQLAVTGGQRAFITIDGSAVLQVYNPSLTAVTDVISAVNPVQIPFSQTGTYYMTIQGSGPVAMSIYIPPVGGNQTVAAPIPSALTPIQFQSGATSSSFSISAISGTPLGYTITALSGQRMTVTTTGNVTITLLGPNQSTLVPTVNAPTHQWIFPLSQGGTYTMIVLGSGSSTLTVSIPAAASGNTSPTQSPGSPTRVTIASGNASTTLKTTLVSGVPQAYVLRIIAGQTLFVSTTGAVDVSITGPDNTVITSGHANFPQRWSAPAATTGDYTFVISGSGSSTLTFYVPPK